MKNINHSVILIILLLLAFTVKAQESGHDLSLGQDTVQKALPEPPQKITRVIKSNPLAIIWGAIPFTSEYRLNYEFIASRNQSSQVSYSFLGKSPILSLMEDTLFPIPVIVRGFRFQASHRFFLNDMMEALGFDDGYAPNGFYISPHVSYATARFTPKFFNTQDIYLRISHFNVNLLGGFQLIVDNICFEVFTGLGYKNNSWIARYSPTVVQNLSLDDASPYYRGPVKLNLGFNIGIGF